MSGAEHRGKLRVKLIAPKVIQSILLLIRPIDGQSCSEQIEQGVKLQIKGNKKVCKF
jgi:hypothetical protein